MNRLQKATLLTELIQQLRQQDSWCGETHIQKAVFFLQELMHVPLEFDFILYKHGPFSFDLRDELTSLRADGLIKLEPIWPYGPRLAPTERCANIQALYSKTLAKYSEAINLIARKLGAKGVSELERLSTALYVIKEAEGDTSVEAKAGQLTRLKPHILPGDAEAAILEVDQLINKAKSTY